MNEYILRLVKVNKRFGGLVSVRDVSFEIEQGEIFGIAGPNGAGKTTLFNVITGHLPCRGDIFLGGKNINGLRPNEICHLGMARTFQMPALFISLSIFDTVRLGSHFGKPKSAGGSVEEAIEFVGLKGKEKLTPPNLDLFDKKLTMLAASLATQPKVLLLDEPIAGLSLPQIRQSVQLIRRIRDELKITILIIEHLMNVLTDISNRLMILNDGAVICLGEPREVVQDKEVIRVYTGVENVGIK